jgi:hypothetical protein
MKEPPVDPSTHLIYPQEIGPSHSVREIRKISCDKYVRDVVFETIRRLSTHELVPRQAPLRPPH